MKLRGLVGGPLLVGGLGPGAPGQFRDIAAFVLQHATFSHHTSSLPKIFLFSPGSRWMAMGYEKRNVGLIVHAISFQDVQLM